MGADITYPARLETAVTMPCVLVHCENTPIVGGHATARKCRELDRVAGISTRP
jgi:hypothetical protein